MLTKVLKINSSKPERKIIREAAEIIKKGGLVAFPTETVYGLGADAFNPQAIRKIFKAKGRPENKPLIVHIAKNSDLKLVVREIPLSAKKLIKKFWPGYLTLVLKKNRKVLKEICAGGKTVAVRIPDNKVARALIKASGTLIAAPSANLAGKRSAVSAKDVLNDLNGRIDLILDSGKAKLGLPSTVLDLTKKPPLIRRLGAVSKEKIEKVLGEVELY